MISKEKFVEYMDALHKWYDWINKLDSLGIVFQTDEPENLAALVYDIILEGDIDYDYDDYADISWVANWCCAPLGQKGFRRMSQWIVLEDAGALYDFIQEMRELGWPDKVENERILKHG